MPGAQNQFVGSYLRTPAVSLTTSGTAETIRWIPAQAIGATLRRNQGLSATYVNSEIWRPVGIVWTITTTITTTAPVVTLWKNGVAAATGGTATMTVAVADATQELTAAFSDYTFAAADAAGDRWSLKVTTSSAAGVATIAMYYATKLFAGVNFGSSTD